MRPAKISTIALAVFLSATVCFAADKAESKPQSFKVPSHGDLLLTVPEGWTQKVQTPPVPSLPPTIMLSPKAAAGARPVCEMLITPMAGRDPKFNSPESLKKLAELRGKSMLSGSKESKIELLELKGDAANGYYYTLTDKAPKPGEFECMTACFVGVGDLMVSATILHHQKDAPEQKLALDALKSARQSAGPATQGAAKTELLKIDAPGGKWALLIGGNLKQVDEQSDGKSRQLMAMSEESGMMVSIFLEPAANRGDSTAVRTFYWSKARNSPIPKKDIKLAKSGEFATVEFLVPDLNQKNMNIYAAHEGIWIDVHLSKVDFTAADQPLFDDIAKSIRFEAAAKK